MAPSRRRTGRSKKTPDPAGVTDDDSHSQGQVQDPEEAGKTQTQDDRCPACQAGQPEDPPAVAEKEQWVRCDACKTWFHWRCVGQGGDLDAVDKWYAHPAGPLCVRRIDACSLCCGGVIGFVGRV